MKSEKFAFLTIAVLHQVVQSTHGYSHVVAGVPNTSLQLIFIVLVITIAPWSDIYCLEG